MHSPRIMAPKHHFMFNTLPMEPVSRTYQYRKIMKPMLERKRRARINKCLDELKDLMTGTLQADGENVSKLEKADILELTVRHLHRLREHNALFLRANNNDSNINMDKFWAGFQHCAVEVSQFLSKYDRNMSGDLVKHIVNYMPNMAAAAAHTTLPLHTPAPTSPQPQPPSATANTATHQRFSPIMHHMLPLQSTINKTTPPPGAAGSATAAATPTPTVISNNVSYTIKEEYKVTLPTDRTHEAVMLTMGANNMRLPSRVKVLDDMDGMEVVGADDNVWRPW